MTAQMTVAAGCCISLFSVARAEPPKGSREWAEAQAARFAELDAQTADFGFYKFAAQATARKYGVAVPERVREWSRNDIARDSQRLYEMTTGATAIAESLALQRMLGQTGAAESRSVDVSALKGIDIKEHPWVEMMKGAKPDAEPMAEFIPHDNWYVRFKTFAKFNEFGELMDQWGTTVTRAYEVSSRDAGLKARLERQICLRSTVIGKLLGPAAIKELAVTGNDGYLREGSDVTVIFHLSAKPLFLAGTAPYIAEARKEFGDRLTEAKDDYHGVAIESFVSPLREISLHRAAVGDYMIYSNSPAGVRRAIDAKQGRAKRLSELLDFQFMRTIYRAGDAAEDGFVYFSDPFIRGLVGPAGKIKEKRRLEALTSLYTATHGAMFAGWEIGKIPGDLAGIMEAAALRPGDLAVPDGTLVWDGERQTAVSSTYGTIRFATPLVELPIDKVTPGEAREYETFRAGYLENWRRFFDPVGIRLAVNDKQVRVETYILPLIENSEYNQLRRWIGDGTAAFDTGTLSPQTLLQMFFHVNPEAQWVGNREDKDIWFTFRFDDSPVYARMLQLWNERREKGWNDALRREETRLFMQSPFTVGAKIGRNGNVGGVVEKRLILEWFNEEGPVTRDGTTYRDVALTKLTFRPDSRWARWSNPEDTPPEKRFLPVLYHAEIDGGFYVGFQEGPFRELIDRSVARREGKAGKDDVIDVNQSLYLSPKAAVNAGAAVRGYLEAETHKRSLANGPILYSLYRCGVVPAEADQKTVAAAAMKWFGFVPVSPDGEPYVFDKAADEVTNRRHGSAAHPKPVAAGIEAGSPLSQLLESVARLRVDLRFREDGINTVLTIDRGTK